jgi:hypothetical protein
LDLRITRSQHYHTRVEENTGAAGNAFLQPKRVLMSETVDGALPVPPELPPNLQAELQRALMKSLGSLDSLRVSLRRHVQRQRNRGVSLGEIEAQLRMLMLEADTAVHPDSRHANGDLTRQIVKWTRAFFSGTKT